MEQISEKRLERAVEHVSDYWFPANPKLVDKIRTQLQDDIQTPDQFLDILATLKQDFSLFLFVFRELVTLVKREDSNVQVKLNPIELMQWAGAERLIQVFDQHGGVISRHRYEDSDTLQVGRIQEMFVSTSCAELLADSYHLDSEAAFSSAVVRQFGHALIAWNYPGIYQESVSQLNPGESLDLRIAQKLGFSPALLALRVMNSWGVEDSYGATLGLEVPEYKSEEHYILDAMGSTLAELCRVGECLARATQGERYPDARDNWFVAASEIESRLGDTGLKRIQDRVFEVTGTFVEIAPEIFDLGLHDRYGTQIEETRIFEVEGNPFLDHCLPNVARRILDVYREIQAADASEGTLKQLIFEVVPAAKFQGGVVYTADPGLMHLMPQMEFGDVELRQIRAIDYSIVLSDADMVTLAFQSVEPVVEYKMSPAGKVVTAMAGMFGRSQKVGVLYLEIPEAVADFMRDDHVIHFQAIRHLLNDCLGLM
ncbi:MAG: hypothetical protein KDD64_14825 [Bdellovibrionales bacterium]|nr:hypothetical protein [Bdellovibrionales bacterium]